MKFVNSVKMFRLGDGTEFQWWERTNQLFEIVNGVKLVEIYGVNGNEWTFRDATSYMDRRETAYRTAS